MDEPKAKPDPDTIYRVEKINGLNGVPPSLHDSLGGSLIGVLFKLENEPSNHWNQRCPRFKRLDSGKEYFLYWSQLSIFMPNPAQETVVHYFPKTLLNDHW